MPATTNRRTATGRLTTSRVPWFAATTGRVGRLATITTLLLAAALLVGCSGTVTVGGPHYSTVNPAAMSAEITRSLRARYPDVRVGRTTCPGGVKLAVGESFQCTADVEGAQLPIMGTLTHVDTDEGYWDADFKLAKAVIDTDRVVEDLRSNLPVKVAFDLASATVDCGTPRVRVVEVGGTIDCTIANGGKQQVVRAVVDDVDGKAHFELADQQPARPQVATGKLGDTLTVYDEADDAVLEVTFTRVKFSKGDEFDQPTHGLYLGAHVKAHALADDQDLLNLYARVGGRLYETAITGSDAFDPQLDPVTLNKGERTAGWLVFDVPARHGQLVLRDLDDKTIGIWKY
jgi:Domain of unknown function (DUF4333)